VMTIYIPNNKEVKFQALFLSIHLFGLSPSNNRTIKSIPSKLIYMPGARPQLYILEEG
jgi:hypothetical protein